MTITLGDALKELLQRKIGEVIDDEVKKTYYRNVKKGTTMTQELLFQQKPILEVLKPIRFQEKIQPSTPQKTAKNEKS